MKLSALSVQKFRNIVDSGEVDIEAGVTCLVGKNESGKTAFLEAARRVKPVAGDRKFNRLHDYPAWREKRDGARDGKSNVRAVSATFTIDDNDRDAVTEELGPVLRGNTLTVHCDYDGEQTYDCDLDESAYVKGLTKGHELPKAELRELESVDNVDALRAWISRGKRSRSSRVRKTANDLESIAKDEFDLHPLAQLVGRVLQERIPDFLYFSDYSKLPSELWIKEVLDKQREERTDSEHTAACLLRLGGADATALVEQDYETRKRELENVANQLTRDALQYWTTNTHLRVHVDLSKEPYRYVDPETQERKRKTEFQLRIRVYDDGHGLSLPLAARSSGFQWFFSFLAAFSEYEASERPLVLLLDEPGVGLHARAQADFLRFIEERLSERCQVVYSTHSRFMVQPSKLHRCRLVEDRGGDVGTKISDNVLAKDKDTTFPLQAALGYDLAQNLFLGEDALVVEGVSDFLYLDTISQWLKDNEREGLRNSIVITPVGGSSKVPTFVALMAPRRIRFSVLVDSSIQEMQQIDDLKESGLLPVKNIIELGELLQTREADIEDLFEVDDYIRLFNGAFGSELSTGDLDGQGTVVSQICRKRQQESFNHTRVAKSFVRLGDEALSDLSGLTLRRFEELFKTVNENFNDEE